MGAVCPAGHTAPEAADHLLRRDAAPEMRQIPLIAALVDDDRLFVLRDPARGNQSILKEISPGISLEGMMLKLKLQYFWPPHAKS